MKKVEEKLNKLDIKLNKLKLNFRENLELEI